MDLEQGVLPMEVNRLMKSKTQRMRHIRSYALCIYRAGRYDFPMSIDIQKFLDFPLTVQLATFLGRVIPPGIGSPLSEILGAWMATRRDSMLARAVRVNQWIARGATSKHDWDLAVQETLKQNGRDLYTLYRNLDHPENLQDKILMDRTVLEILNRPKFAPCGLIVAGLHLSIFDLVLQHFFQQGFQAVVLTLPNPQGGRRVEYERRKKTGVNILPTSLNGLRHAIKYLQDGGTVITGIDRPISESKYHPRFFGYSAALPTHQISLALQTRVPIVVMAVIQLSDGNYHLMSSKPIEMEQYADRREAIIGNAERVLKQAEAFIRMAPEQWNVPLPVWPELLDIVPG